MPSMSDKTRMDAAQGIGPARKKVRRRIIGTLGLLFVVAATIWGIVTRFQNPTMTETQLFVEFWGRWFAIAVISVVGLGAANLYLK